MKYPKFRIGKHIDKIKNVHAGNTILIVRYEPQIKLKWWVFWQTLAQWWGNHNGVGFTDYRIVRGHHWPPFGLCTTIEDAKEIIEDAKKQECIHPVGYYPPGTAIFED